MSAPRAAPPPVPHDSASPAARPRCRSYTPCRLRIINAVATRVSVDDFAYAAQNSLFASAAWLRFACGTPPLPELRAIEGPRRINGWLLDIHVDLSLSNSSPPLPPGCASPAAPPSCPNRKAFDFSREKLTVATASRRLSNSSSASGAPTQLELRQSKQRLQPSGPSPLPRRLLVSATWLRAEVECDAVSTNC